ncbi:hypothetical protein HOC_04057 [Hyphomonas oceanitis SCH89]|uniref:Uncharacterized protein n=1 Tax=Hyphomonas oceanitis SCH89 TaxID=1280953 RepID=A0A059GA63_9PROT|nr:hypothetical protein HOC_04057 [Hyphomonas oceanitis SCH89]
MKIKPAPGFEDNSLYFYQGDEIFRPMQLQPNMRLGKARLDILKCYPVFSSVFLVVLFIPIYVSVMGFRWERTFHIQDSYFEWTRNLKCARLLSWVFLGNTYVYTNA